MLVSRPRFITSAALAAFASSPVLAAELGYYSQPALFDDRLVFVSEGDLWTATFPPAAAPAAGATTDPATPIIAYRLTTSDGTEGRPQISPDGQWLAFSGEYDGNVDVFVMPIDGGAPRRLTFHPEGDLALGWTPDGRSVIFRSARSNPLNRPELYRVSATGGMPIRYDFGECSLASLSSTGQRIAFTRWSNESWTWKRYRGGTAPEIWLGDFSTNTFKPLTAHTASDLFPMWLLGRVFFLSDRSGTANIFSDSADGGDLKQHTTFAPVAGNPTAVEGYDVRWPSADAQRRGSRLVFCQAGGLALLDAADNSVRRLDIHIASDRVAVRQRFTNPMETATEFNLSPDGETLILGSRGELLSVNIESGTPMQLSRTSESREWGASYLDDKRIVLIADAGNEQQLAVLPADGSEALAFMTQDREAWLFPPIGSPDGRWVAFGDKTLRLHIMNTESLQRRQVDQSEAWEIRDYRFSPDSKWLAYTKPMPNGFGVIQLYNVETQRIFPVSSGLHNDREARWDPAGKYLYFISDRHLDPILSDMDFEHAFLNTARFFAVSLGALTPPPVKSIAQSVEFDLEKWANGEEEKKDKEGNGDEVADDAEGEAGADAAPQDQPAQVAAEDAEAEDEEKKAPPPVIQIDTDGLMNRQYALPIEAGNYGGLEALKGSITYLSEPERGLLDDDFGEAGFGKGRATLHHYGFVKEEAKTLAEKIPSYALSAGGSALAYPNETGFTVIDPASPEEPKEVAVAGTHLRIDVRKEWEQILAEAWRLQRDFYWAPNYVGLDWPAMRVKYSALLPRIGTRNELNDLIGQLIGELGTSHTYVWGGEQHDEAVAVTVGLLGADIEFDGGAYRIVRIIPGQPWDDDYVSPLAQPYLGVKEGTVLVAINGIPLAPPVNVYDLLQDQAEKIVRLTIADDPAGANQRDIKVKAIASERAIRYAAWVEANRLYVEKASEGKLGYLHIPDMGGEGLVAFSRLFYPQFTKNGLVVDIRDNGGGFVSQMIISRLARKVWAFMQPRHGVSERYPAKTLHGYSAVIIDQHAGSDGDIFPASFRLNHIGPLIGTRTWGGVVGIRGDKPFVDFGLSTQPEFAWWEPTGGWSLENVGVEPDITVEITPEDRRAGRDPQLDTAIQWLLNKLKEAPMDLPKLPAWPVRVK